MTRKETLAAIKALGLAGRYSAEYGEYRVTYSPADVASAERREALASYTPDSADALGTARAMREHFDGLTPGQRAAVVSGTYGGA
jgi:hypothetical protein